MQIKLLFAYLLVIFVNMQAVCQQVSETLTLDEKLKNSLFDVEPEIFVQDELYKMINGGADIYLEYGFDKAYSYSLEKENKSIRIEIYKMNDVSSAYGIYSFNKSDDDKGRKIRIGIILYDYYLLLWAGHYFATISSSDNSKDLQDELISIAEKISKTIDGKTEVPVLIKKMSGEKAILSNFKYIKGNIGLSNTYTFGYKNVFNFIDGVIGKVENSTVFILNYPDETESLKWFKNSKITLKKDKRFKVKGRQSGEYSMIDKHDNHLIFNHHGDCILICLNPGDNYTDLLTDLKERLGNQ